MAYKIRITRLPPGQVSRKKREALVGMQFWTNDNPSSSQCISLNELCNAKKNARDDDLCISVYALLGKFRGRDENDPIAQWWIKKLSRLTTSNILVRKDICEVISEEKYAPR